MEQNATLKKDFMMAERKLGMRNDRIQSLELLLQDAQQKLVEQNQKFEVQLQAVREKLEITRTAHPNAQQNQFTFGRIAKPLRGGGASTSTTMNGTHGSTPPPATQQAPAQSKRMSWLGGWRTTG